MPSSTGDSFLSAPGLKMAFCLLPRVSPHCPCAPRGGEPSSGSFPISDAAAIIITGKVSGIQLPKLGQLSGRVTARSECVTSWSHRTCQEKNIIEAAGELTYTHSDV